MQENYREEFWMALFSPTRSFIGVYLLTLLAITLFGNLVYSLFTAADTISGEEFALVIGVILGLLLVAGFVWHNRMQKTFIPFTETTQLARFPVLFAVPSNVDAIGKMVRYHSDILRHVWLIADESLNDNYNKCKQQFETEHLKIHRIEIPKVEGGKAAFDGVCQAVEEAIKMGITKEEIVVDITGGLKTMTVGCFLAALSQSLKMSYLGSDFEQWQGVVIRAGEEFKVVEFDVGYLPFAIIPTQVESRT